MFCFIFIGCIWFCFFLFTHSSVFSEGKSKSQRPGGFSHGRWKALGYVTCGILHVVLCFTASDL